MVNKIKVSEWIQYFYRTTVNFIKMLILLIVLFGILGFIFGYLFFGKIGGEYLHIKFLFQWPANPIESFGRKVIGVQ